MDKRRESFLIITLCTVCAEGLCNWSRLYVYVTKYCPFGGIFLIKKLLERRLWCFPFTLRNREYDGWLLVHSRSSTTLVSLLMLVCPLGVMGVIGALGAHMCSLIGRCIVMPTTVLIWNDDKSASYLLQCVAGVCSAASISLTVLMQCCSMHTFGMCSSGSIGTSYIVGAWASCGITCA